MSEGEFVGERCVFVVAQRPFESRGEVQNLFCTLLPVLHEDGREAVQIDFPANGDVWWKVIAGKRPLAVPSRLLTGRLIPSVQLEKAWYQVDLNEIDAVDSTEYLEVLDVPTVEIANVRQLITGWLPIRLNHYPLHFVHVLLGDSLYGPFKTESEQVNEEVGEWRVKLSTTGTDASIIRCPAIVLGKLPPKASFTLNAEISLTDMPHYQSRKTHQCRYRLIRTQALLAVIPLDATRIPLQTDEAILSKAAKKLLSVNKGRQLLNLVREFRAIADANPEVSTETKSTVESLLKNLEISDASARELAGALLESGLLEKSLEEARRKAEEVHIQKNVARLQGEIGDKVKDIHRELAAMNAEKTALEDSISSTQKRADAELAKELVKRREEFDRGLREEELRIESSRIELKRQSEVLENNLREVADELKVHGDKLVNQFLAISPLLGQLSLLPGRSSDAAPPAMQTAIPARLRFEVPAFAVRETPTVPEGEFFQRFRSHVEASGFKHRAIDLAAFHLSVKCNDLSVLGGYPGTGKSSLVRLYAEAMGGGEWNAGPRRFLHVGVSPSWQDSRDLVGYTNALDRCFQPADTNLFQTLIHAQEEWKCCGIDSRVYIVCLDEMNLSQVEHYFGQFLQALERPPGQREINCFSPAVVSADDPFASWSSLNLPPNLRFVGTVNFDETTRQLSQRVLDRANLIRLRPPQLTDAVESTPVGAKGTAIAAREYRDWVNSPAPALEPVLGKLIDDLGDPLRQLGCPLNPRRTNAIRKFIGSAAAVCRPEEALDLQIAQRVLPQIRNLFASQAGDHIKRIRDVLGNSPFGFSESLHWLEEIDSDGAGSKSSAGGLPR